MKTLLLILAVGVCPGITAQALYNNGALVYLSDGASLQINGNIVNTSGSTLSNNGQLNVSGDFSNSEVMSSYHNGTISFIGTAGQTINGAADIWTNNVNFNNASGITFNKTIHINGNCSFTNGLVKGGNGIIPLVFTATGNHAGASDASHVNDYVIKEGSGIFTYPVGDESRYQKIDLDLATNTGGMKVKYNVGAAGSGPFIGSNPLLFVNTYEYWDVAPLATASGTIKVYWDDYNNVGIGSNADLRVAHFTGGSWVNEGASTTSGTISSGSVTSNPVNTWSPFTLGSISQNSTLPLHWLSVAANLNLGNHAEIMWQVSERNVAFYDVEKSSQGNNFETIATLNGKGDGENSYVYVEPALFQGPCLYRIKQTDTDGAYAYSSIMRLTTDNQKGVSVHPSPFTGHFTIASSAAQSARIITLEGRPVKMLALKAGNNNVDGSGWQKGIYIINFEHHPSIRIVKQ